MSYWFEQHTHSLNWWCRCHLLRNSEQRSDTTRRMGGHGEVTVFADTNLGTRIAFNAPPDITAASLKSTSIKKPSFFSSSLYVLGLYIFPIWRFCWFCCVISLATFASMCLHVFGSNNTVSLCFMWIVAVMMTLRRRSLSYELCILVLHVYVGNGGVFCNGLDRFVSC